MTALGGNFTRNAKLAFERRVAERAALGQTYTVNDLAREMVPHLFTDAELAAEAERKGKTLREIQIQKAETTALQIRRYFGEKPPQPSKDPTKPPKPQKWRQDYQDAFSFAMSIPMERLRGMDYEQAKIPEADWATFFAQALGRRLAPKQIKVVVEQLKEALERPGMFDLVIKVREAILRADNADAALTAVSKVLAHVRTWPTAETRGRLPKKIRQ